jgi:hypothetical protein
MSNDQENIPDILQPILTYPAHQAYLIETALFSLGGTRDQFLAEVAEVVDGAIQYVLDGENDLDDLEACEKTYIGTKVEKRFLKHFGLPRKTKKDKQTKLDTVVGGFDVDIKFTVGNNWMIPPEAVGEWCFLLRTDWPNRTVDLGILKMDVEKLTKGTNRDSKKSVNRFGKNHIVWLGQKIKLTRKP